MIPFLRWAGSKRKLLPVLREYWDDRTGKYIEPFMGSACFFFAIKPEAAVIGDTNEELVQTFEAVRDNPVAVHNYLRPLRRNETTYYIVRDSWDCYKEPARTAARFIYLNRLCFNGIYRTNTKGEFNVPYGGESTGSFPSLKHLKEIGEALQKATICRNDFEQTLNAAKSGDFVYLDPPYSVENRRVFKQYGSSVFGLADLERLARRLIELDSSGVSFVLSYAMCEEALRLFKRWRIRRRMTTRNVSGFAEHRRQAVELLITNIK
jgi:DNA adenine methylase